MRLVKAFAGWVLAGRSNALAAACGFALSGSLFPPLLLPALAVPALVALRRGAREGMAVTLGSACALAALTFAVWIDLWFHTLVMIVLWVLVWAVSQVYRRYASAGWMINAAVCVGVVLVAAIHLTARLWEDTDPFIIWLSVLRLYLRPVLEQAQLAQNTDDMDSLLSVMAAYMTGGVAAAISLLIILSLLLARWWQAMLFNPGGFQREFHGLKIGRAIVWLTLALIAATLVLRSNIGMDLLMVLWLTLIFQGLAVVHHLALQTDGHVGWLIVLYVFMAVLPYTYPALFALGVAETWFNTRELIRKKATDEPDNKD